MKRKYQFILCNYTVEAMKLEKGISLKMIDLNFTYSHPPIALPPEKY